MRLISIPGFVATASLALAPAAFAGSPDHGPHVVPNVHDASTPHTGPHVSSHHEGEHHGNPMPFADRIAANAALTAKPDAAVAAEYDAGRRGQGIQERGAVHRRAPRGEGPGRLVHGSQSRNDRLRARQPRTGHPRSQADRLTRRRRRRRRRAKPGPTSPRRGRRSPIASRPTRRSLAKVTPLLPSGMTLADAAKGFRSEGQFIAALHAAKDLNVSFASLKAELTGSPRDSLSQAIHDVRPTADAKAAAKTAEQEAHTDIKSTRPPDGTTTPTTNDAQQLHRGKRLRGACRRRARDGAERLRRIRGTSGWGTRGTAPSRSTPPKLRAHHLLGGLTVRLAGRRADSSDGHGQRGGVLAALAGDRRQ